MVIVHFACINDKKLDGVSVVVPQHVISQSQYAEVIFINVNNISILDESLQTKYDGKDCLERLNTPFNHPDLVVFHEIYRKQYIGIINYLRKNNIKYIIIPHGELNEQAQKRKFLKKSIANLLIFSRIAKDALALQCLSKRELIKTHFGKEKFVGTNGISIPSNAKKKFNKEIIKVVYIGRLDPYHKGLDLMLTALSEIKKEVKHRIILDIYGPDENGYFYKIKRMIDNYKIDDFVHFHHEVLEREKERILLDSDIFIQTSRFEGMPMGILEAMSYGLPCILTEGTTLAGYIEEHKCGWCSANKPSAIAKAVMKMLSEVDKFEIYGQNARKAVSSDYSWDNIVAGTIAHYEQLLMK